jgi:Na+-translocating ferredoxin:NAD+ oxidoreductase subunit B
MSATTNPTLADRIDSWLPQTQCTRCGYPRCRDYANAIAAGGADINRCPPGGEVTLQALGALLGVPVKPLAPECGAHEARTRAVIDEAVCIGCRKCIDVCPVDAIVGARKLMHTVIAHECNGCGLCLPPCPVDCIALVPVAVSAAAPWPEYPAHESARWRMRTEARLARLSQRKSPRAQRLQAETAAPDRATIQADIRAAIERVKQKKARRAPAAD